jgi:hypothetical protein
MSIKKVIQIKKNKKERKHRLFPPPAAHSLSRSSPTGFEKNLHPTFYFNKKEFTITTEN